MQNHIISYRNIGYNDAIDENYAKSNVKITRHYHSDTCYCTGSMIVTKKIEDADDDYYATGKAIRATCNMCGSEAIFNGNTNWYKSYNIGDVLFDNHYAGGSAASHFYTGAWKQIVCNMNNGQVTSIIVDGINYMK